MEFGTPVRHIEDKTVWFRVPLVSPFLVKGVFGPERQDSEGSVSLQTARTHMLQALLHSKGLFNTPPTLTQLETLSPPWILPDLHWSQRIRWTSPKPAGSFSLHIYAVWISRSLIVPECKGTVLPGCIDLDFSPPDLEEVDEIETSEGVVHLRSMDKVRMEANANVNQLWKIARRATEVAESAEENFFKTYGESFCEDSESDSDESA